MMRTSSSPVHARGFLLKFLLVGDKWCERGWDPGKPAGQLSWVPGWPPRSHHMLPSAFHGAADILQLLCLFPLATTLRFKTRFRKSSLSSSKKLKKKKKKNQISYLPKRNEGIYPRKNMYMNVPGSSNFQQPKSSNNLNVRHQGTNGCGLVAQSCPTLWPHEL